MKVYFTVDVEVWCDGWQDIDSKFPEAFRRYVYGPTQRGDYGLPFQLKILKDHGLSGVFFTEPLFSARFGMAPLTEIVGLILDAGQEVQLHLHPEWVDEAKQPLLPEIVSKRQHMRDYSEEEQSILIHWGARRLQEAGAKRPNAFRAGSFAYNQETIKALLQNGIKIDSSHNPTYHGDTVPWFKTLPLLQPVTLAGVHEFPMSVMRETSGQYKHLQLSAVSHREMESALWQALERGWEAVVILSHNFELMDRNQIRKDPVVTRRFLRLCEFLDRHRDSFQSEGFTTASAPAHPPSAPSPVVNPKHFRFLRQLEQLVGRIYK